jgi:hypothetical protein
MRAIMIILSFSILLGCSTGNEYTIKGTLTGFEGIEWVYIQKLWSEDLQVDSTRIKNEKFSFKGTIDIPEIWAIFPMANKDGCQPVCTFILEPENLEIHLDTISLFNDGTVVKGGPFNEEFNSVFKEKQDKYMNEINNLRLELYEASEDDKVVIEQKLRVLNAAETKYTTDYIESNPGSPVSVYLMLWKYRNLPLDEWGHLLSIFSPEMKSTAVYKRMESDYKKQLAL